MKTRATWPMTANASEIIRVFSRPNALISRGVSSPKTANAMGASMASRPVVNSVNSMSDSMRESSGDTETTAARSESASSRMPSSAPTRPLFGEATLWFFIVFYLLAIR